MSEYVRMVKNENVAKFLLQTPCNPICICYNKTMNDIIEAAKEVSLTLKELAGLTKDMKYVTMANEIMANVNQVAKLWEVK